MSRTRGFRRPSESGAFLEMERRDALLWPDSPGTSRRSGLGGIEGTCGRHSLPELAPLAEPEPVPARNSREYPTRSRVRGGQWSLSLELSIHRWHSRGPPSEGEGLSQEQHTFPRPLNRVRSRISENQKGSCGRAGTKGGTIQSLDRFS